MCEPCGSRLCFVFEINQLGKNWWNIDNWVTIDFVMGGGWATLEMNAAYCFMGHTVSMLGDCMRGWVFGAFVGSIP